MKRIKYIVGYICLLVSLGLSNIGYAQEVQYEEHSLRIKVKSSASGKNIPDLLNADSVLNAWIQDIRQSFPHSQDEMLRRVYLLHFDCSREQIQERLTDFPWIEEIMPMEKVQENMLYTPTDWFWKVTKTDDPTYLWHLTKIEAEKAWDITKGSPDIKIAVIDGGFDATHPDLAPKMIYDYDAYEPNLKFRPGGCIGSGHGTKVASFIAASTDDAETSHADLAAIGFNCKIVGYNTSSYLEKIHHAAFVEKVDVLTTSTVFTGPVEESLAKKLIPEVLNLGIIIVAPAGNGLNSEAHNYDPVLKRDAPFYPFHPSYDKDNRIIIVSSTDINDKHTHCDDEKQDDTHSHFPEVTVCAPGYKVMGAIPTVDDAGNPVEWPYYGGNSGTSFSTPIVAGLCGLMKSIFPRLTPARAKQILETTTDPIQDANLYPGQLGAGRINAYKAVLAVKQYADACQAIYANQTIDKNINRDVCILSMKNTTITNNASVTFNVELDATLDVGFSVENGATLIISSR